MTVWLIGVLLLLRAWRMIVGFPPTIPVSKPELDSWPATEVGPLNAVTVKSASFCGKGNPENRAFAAPEPTCAAPQASTAACVVVPVRSAVHFASFLLVNLMLWS